MDMKMKIILLFQFFIVLACPCLAEDYSQSVEIPSSPNPVGSGARALGMAAFIAVADDATAASWNPAGLVQLQRPEISFVGDMFHRIEDNLSESNSEVSGSQSISETNLNYFSIAYPFRALGHGMVVSLSYQRLFDFTREWNFPLISHKENIDLHQEIAYEQKGDLSAVGLAYSAEITPWFSVGMTLNLWDDGLTGNEWQQNMVQQMSVTIGSDPVSFEVHSYDRYTFSGFNANLGILWEPVKNRFVIGAVLKTPFKADLKREHQIVRYSDSSESDDGNPDISDETMEMPMSYGLGFAYKFSPAFTLSLDIYRTEWDDFVMTNSEGKETSAITGMSVSESDIDPTHQVRMGAEYLLKLSESATNIPLCAGVFYDPEPAPGNPDDFFGFSIGSGINFGDFRFDLAYQYRFGNDVRDFLLKYEGDFSQDVEEHTLYSSVVIHF